jgi:type III secretion protein C
LKKFLHLLCYSGLTGILVSSSTLSSEEEKPEAPLQIEEAHSINFNNVPVIEFIRFVSKISGENFIFNNDDLGFTISLSTGKAVSSEKVLQALVQLLGCYNLFIEKESDYYVIKQYDEQQKKARKALSFNPSLLTASNTSFSQMSDLAEEYEFFVYKVQYHSGLEIEQSLKKISVDMRNQPNAPIKLINAIQSLQWIKATNSLLCSGDPETLCSLRKLIDRLDIPLRQVFIEILVIETDAKKSMDFGLQWSVGAQYQNRLGLGVGNFVPTHSPGGSFANMMQGISPTNPPAGLSQFPMVPGLNLGVIGDIIMHKGKSFLSLGSLVSALQTDGNSTIVLNQKIITQDNKKSTIFVGDNIPFTGSVVQTVGQGQQLTANVEYRDVGVSLNVTPRLGEDEIITLEIEQEITESLDQNLIHAQNTANGIRTTKTNMSTTAHVPDQHFLIVSGMIRNAKLQHKTGIPCLGGLPVVGAAFSKTLRQDEKRNIVIFARPYIIRSFEEYHTLTKEQENIFERQAVDQDFRGAIELVDPAKCE